MCTLTKQSFIAIILVIATIFVIVVLDSTFWIVWADNVAAKVVVIPNDCNDDNNCEDYNNHDNCNNCENHDNLNDCDNFNDGDNSRDTNVKTMKIIMTVTATILTSMMILRTATIPMTGFQQLWQLWWNCGKGKEIFNRIKPIVFSLTLYLWFSMSIEHFQCWWQ